MQDEIPMVLEREAGMPEQVPMVGVGFCLHALQSETKSAEAGRPIFDDIEFVQIVVPGDRQSVVFQPATDRHRQRFPKAYAMFKQQSAVAVEGTPIEQWPALTRAQALTFKASHIPTVETLAEVHDGNLEKLGFGAREWREKARAFVAQAKDSAAAQKLAAENQALRDQLSDQQRQINELAQRLQGLGDSGRATAQTSRETSRETTPGKAKKAARAKAA